MSTALVDRPPLAADPVEPPRRDIRFERAIRVAWVVLAIQLVAMILWSSLLYSRWGNTWDYAIRYQGWWGIAHGNLDPYVTVANHHLWQDHFELINWPLAPVSLLWPGGLWPLWIQDLMIFGGEAGALLLVTDAVRRPGWPRRLPGWLAVGLVTLLLVANPWVYESISFDFHYQSVGAACFAMLACREMIRGRTRWLVLWVVLCLACGDIAGTYLAAVGVGGVLAGRDSRRRGWALAAAGVGWFLLVSVLGGGKGSSLSGHYGYLAAGAAAAGGIGIASILKGLFTHPGALVSHLWAARVDLWAYVVGSGGLGLFTPLSVLPLLVLFESGASNGAGLRAIAYENYGAVLFVAPLSVLTLAWLTRQLDGGWVSHHLRRGARWLRSKWVPRIIAVVLALNALVWGAVWIPQVSGQWLRTTAATASTLNQAERMIPASAEVIASQGIIGRLSAREWLYQISSAAKETYPLESADAYFVVVPYQGIETASVQAQLGVIAELAGPLHAKLLLDRNGVWLFRFHRPPAIHSLHFAPSPTEPAWALRTATGAPLLAGPASDWAMTQRRSTSGYVLYGADWNLLPGSYRATITLSSSVPIQVETWDSTTDVLLSRDHVPATNGHVAVQSVVHVEHTGGDLPYSGWGPFSFLPEEAPKAADRIEIRIFTQGGGDVRIYNLEMQPIHVPRTTGGDQAVTPSASSNR